MASGTVGVSEAIAEEAEPSVSLDFPKAAQFGWQPQKHHREWPEEV
jgi:hypothetical protein